MKFQKFSKSRACPTCRSTEVYRMRRVGLTTRVVCKVSDYRPYWCSNCDTFFFALKRPKSAGMGEAYGMTNQPKVGGKPQVDGLTH